METGKGEIYGMHLYVHMYSAFLHYERPGKAKQRD